MLQISELYTYPIKSLAGVRLNEAIITDRGIKYDRRWMLIDDNNRFISQREHAAMALLIITIGDDFFTVNCQSKNTSLNIPFTLVNQDLIAVTVWGDTCNAQLVSDEADRWFTSVLGMNCRLVYMPDQSRRPTDPDYTQGDSITSFSDGYPFLLIGQSSLDDLNSKLTDTVTIDRFRPNIVFTGGDAYLEDQMNSIIINNINFKGVKLCARCNVIGINQSDATTGKEPSKTLASYRRKNNNVYFGQNLIHTGSGSIKVGDELLISSLHTDARFFIPEKAI